MTLSLAFLGTFVVKRGEKAISHFRSTNVQGLLVYLALQAGRAFPRDVLATLFWPEQPEGVAKRNLRQTIYQLRQVLGDDGEQETPFLLVTRHTVQFNRASGHTLDVADFLRAIGDGDLTNAARAYGGELLPGFSCDSLGFEDWLRGERERLHRLALEALSRLTARHLRNGRLQEAQASARRQLALEPWSETAQRQLMEALALSGRRSAALAQFAQCREILEEELGIAPAPETLALAERIENDDLPPLDAGLIAGRYALGEELARSVRGVVYRGRDRRTGGRVAIKMLDGVRTAGDPTLLERFLREGEILRQLDHPNIVKMLATDEREGRHYLVMEYVEGGDLRRLLDGEGALPLPRVLSLALDLADALTRAHRLEILHRDVKPANVLLDGEGRAHLSDFGIARLGKRSHLTEHAAEPHAVLGTLAYLSPEACLGLTLDERADIWSFGLLLYEMLAGERPFAGSAPAAVINRILHDPLPDIRQRRPDIPEALEDLLYRMLVKNRVDRMPSVRLVGAELEAILQADPAPAADGDFLQQEAAAREKGAFDTPTPERLQRTRHNLPAQATPFVGRDPELAEVERLLTAPDTRLVTIAGPGGIGKTRLALESAERLVDISTLRQTLFPHGIFLVELAPLGSAEEMLAAMATALGFALDKEGQALQQIANFLSNKQLLLILDNFEHLLAASVKGAELVAAFLKAAPQLTILVTSRQRMNLSSETVLVLEGLDFPQWQTTADALSYSAVQLFTEGARRVRVGFDLAEADLPAVTRICRLTEGMPLGILLAAAWIDTLTPDEISREMQADVEFLARELADLPPRQRSMRAVFDTSWALLTEAEQEILAKLSVFRGGFTRERAQTVTGATLHQLLALVHKSLVQRDVASGRFKLHELLRQLAAEMLAALPAIGSDTAETVVRTAHSRAYLGWMASHEDGLHRGRQLETLRVLRPDDRNIEAAVLWAAQQGEADLLLSVLRSLSLYFMLSGRAADAIRLYRQALQRLPPGDDRFKNTTDRITLVRASLLNRLQDHGFDEDEKGRRIDLDRLYTFFKARGARLDEALVCQHLAHRALREGNLPQAIAYFSKQTEISKLEGEAFRLPLSLARTALLHLLAGEVEKGLAVGKQAKALAEATNDHLHKHAATYLAALHTLFGKNDYRLAQKQFGEVVEHSYQQWSDGFNAIAVLGGLAYQGYVAVMQGKLAEARQFWEKMMDVAAVRNDPQDKVRTEALSSLISITEGKPEAVNMHALATSEAGVLNFGPIGLALTAYAREDRALAARTIIEAWSMPISKRWPTILVQFMPVAASLLADEGQHARAAALMAMARAHPGCPHGWWEIMVLVQGLDARVQAALSSAEVAAAQAQGREMDVTLTATGLLEELKALAGASQ